jgi:hypothetical protein
MVVRRLAGARPNHASLTLASVRSRERLVSGVKPESGGIGARPVKGNHDNGLIGVVQKPVAHTAENTTRHLASATGTDNQDVGLLGRSDGE